MAADSSTGRSEARRSQRRKARLLALRLALVYALAAGLWIILSDGALGWLGLPLELERQVSSVKGLLFVLVTAALLYLLALRFVHGMQASQERYARLFDNAVEGLTVLRVIRRDDGVVGDLEIADMNPIQAARTGLSRSEIVGRRLSRPEGLDERTRSYLDVAASAAAAGEPARSELHVESDGAYELLEAFPIGPDRWAVAAMDITDVRRAEQALRRQEDDIRRAYVDVLDAVTGGKLVLLTEEELTGELGAPLTEAVEFTAAEELGEARRLIAAAATKHFPAWGPTVGLRTATCEALANALKHAGGGVWRVHALDDRLQVVVRDAGPGIDFRHLPRATLVSGFSTVSSLGLGFTIMLQTCERLLLSTRPGRTSVVLEFAAQPPEAVTSSTKAENASR